MVLLVVRFALSALRAVAEVGFFLEAQRFLLRFVRPTSIKALSQIENHLLGLSRTPVRRRWVRVPGTGHALHTLVVGDERRPKIVLLHGHSMSAAFYFRNFDDLVSIGYCVYAIDLLGWGRSDRPRFTGRTADDSVQWYLGSLAGALKVLKLTHFTLVGHSLGAYVALEYARAFPNAVDRLVLVSPAASGREIPLKRALYFSLPPQSIVRRGGLMGYLLFIAYYPAKLMYIADRLREYTYQLAAQSPPSGEEAIIPIIRVHGMRRASCVRPLIENVDKLPMPVRIVCGESDSSMPVEDVHALYREMRRVNCQVQLSVIQGADHCPHIEKPSEFCKVIAEFRAAKGGHVAST